MENFLKVGEHNPLLLINLFLSVLPCTSDNGGQSHLFVKAVKNDVILRMREEKRFNQSSEQKLERMLKFVMFLQLSEYPRFLLSKNLF